MISCIMRTGRRVNNRISDDRGLSLVELIVVISIMAIMTGLIAISASIIFTRDASYVATRIDDELSETRMYSISRAGDFYCILHIADAAHPKNSTIEIMDKGGTIPTKTVKLDKSVTIDVTGSEGFSAGAGQNVYFVFNKSSGKVNYVSVDEPDEDDIAKGTYKIKVTSTRNTSKVEAVTLVAGTGRHFTDKKTETEPEESEGPEEGP